MFMYAVHDILLHLSISFSCEILQKTRLAWAISASSDTLYYYVRFVHTKIDLFDVLGRVRGHWLPELTLDDVGRITIIDEDINRQPSGDTLQISATSLENDRYVNSWIGRLGSYGG